MTHRVSPLVRTALFVRDLERALRFYRDLLGLREVYYQGELGRGNAWRLLGVPAGSACRAVILKAEGPAIGMVGLFEVAGVAEAPVTPAATGARAGETCLVFYCSDLGHIHAALEDFGGSCVCAPLALEVDGHVKQREMTLRDPDGVLVNLIEWDPQRDERPEHQSGQALPAT